MSVVHPAGTKGGTLAYVRAAIYVRISHDKTGDEAGITRQRDDCVGLARHRGWTVITMYSDNDLSATYAAHRPGYEAMMTAVRRGEIDRVIVWHTSRIWRNRRERADGIEQLRAAEVSLVPVRGPELDMTTAYGRGMAGLVGEFDTMEVEIKSERQKRANAQAAALGRRSGGRRAFGYGPVIGVNAATGEEIINYDGVRTDEAAAFVEQYRVIMAGGKLAACARDLNDRGLYTPQKTRTGKPSTWTAQTLRTAMLNPRVIGVRAIKTGRDSWREVAPAVWPAIVDTDLFRTVEAILRDPSRRSSPHGQVRRFLLTGAGKCGVCGGFVHSGANNLRQRLYRCRTGGHIARVAVPVDEYVRDVVLARIQRDDAAALLHTGREDIETLRERADGLRARRRGLAALVADGTYTAAEVRDLADGLDRQIDEITAQMTDVNMDGVLGDLVRAEDALAVWEDMTIDKRTAAVNALMTVTLLAPGRGTRTFREDTVQIEWRR